MTTKKLLTACQPSACVAIGRSASALANSDAACKSRPYRGLPRLASARPSSCPLLGMSAAIVPPTFKHGRSDGRCLYAPFRRYRRRVV
eukprot:scaffold3766_cov124-Isochrysis_galbana.AAC.7